MTDMCKFINMCTLKHDHALKISHVFGIINLCELTHAAWVNSRCVT